MRRLLRRLRDIMARPGSAQERLDRIVNIIAAEMVAEVCSAYVMRAGEVLELFATIGLRLRGGASHAAACRRRPGRRHRRDRAAARARRRAEAPRFRLSARNRRGDLSLADGRAGPARRPCPRRAGRAEPHAAPLRRRRDRGRADRRDGDRRIDRHRRARQPARNGARPRRGRCRCGSTGSASTPASRSRRPCCTSRASRSARSSPRISRPSCARLRQAMAAMQRAIDGLVATSHRLGAGEHRDVIEAYRMFAADRGWLVADHRGGQDRADRRGRGRAGQRRDPRAAWRRSADPLLRERLFDLEDLANRLQQFLSGAAPGPADAGAVPASSCSSPRRWVRPNCSTTRIAGSSGWCWRRARRPRTSRSSRAPSTSRSSGRVHDATGRVEPGRPRRRRRRPRAGADPPERGHPAIGRRRRSRCARQRRRVSTPPCATPRR